MMMLFNDKKELKREVEYIFYQINTLIKRNELDIQFVNHVS